MPYFDFPVVTKYRVVRVDSGYEIYADQISTKRIVVKDMPSIENYSNEYLIGMLELLKEELKATTGESTEVDESIPKGVWDDA